MKNKKILLIEDDKDLIDIYRNKFNKSDLKTEVAVNVKEAIEKIKKDKYSLILLDIRLPEENGIEFLKKANKFIRVDSIPIIAFSNYDTPKIKKEAKEFGANRYIIKSNHTPNEVVKLIKSYL